MRVTGRKLQVGNLGRTMENHDLGRLFAPYGTVRNAVVIRTPDTGRSAGYGFVEMESEREAGDAIAGLDGREYGGRALSVGHAASWGDAARVAPGRTE